MYELANNVFLSTRVKMATYVLILSSVRALLVNQGRVRLDNVVLHQAVELLHEECQRRTRFSKG
jgi:hypothetical protein